MRWTPGGTSRNVEDRRGSGGMGMAPMGIGGTVVLLVLSLIFGRDFVTGSDEAVAPDPRTAGGQVQQTPEEATEVKFVSFVLDSAQAVWSKILPQQMGAQWRDAKLVLFRNATPTGCGVGQSAMGPFYCPLDEKIYIDLAFYEDLRSRFGAPGDFAQAYVLTHELGHHVQHVLGMDQRVRQAQESNPSQANALSVRLELQADCYAGVWANKTREQVLEPGDIEEGLNAAASVGDDRIQRAARGRVNTESFTHGSSAQRTMWFERGFRMGNPKDCNTFSE